MTDSRWSIATFGDKAACFRAHKHKQALRFESNAHALFLGPLERRKRDDLLRDKGPDSGRF